MKILILGYGRSGSTILETAIAYSQGLISLGETIYLGREISGLNHCRCSTNYNNCPIYGNFVEYIQEKNLDILKVLRFKYVFLPKDWLKFLNLKAYKDLSNLGVAYTILLGNLDYIESSKELKLLLFLKKYTDLEFTSMRVSHTPQKVFDSWRRNKHNSRNPAWDFKRKRRRVILLEYVFFHFIAGFFVDMDIHVERISSKNREFGVVKLSKECFESTFYLEKLNHRVAGNPLSDSEGYRPLDFSQPIKTSDNLLDRIIVRVMQRLR